MTRKHFPILYEKDRAKRSNNYALKGFRLEQHIKTCWFKDNVITSHTAERCTVGTYTGMWVSPCLFATLIAKLFMFPFLGTLWEIKTARGRERVLVPPHQMLKSRFWTWKLVDATCIASFRIRDLLRWFSLSVVGAKVGLHPPSVPRIQRKLQIYILDHKQKFNKRDFSITWSQSITPSTRNRESALKRTLSVYLLYFRKKVDSLSSRWELISALSSSSSVSSFSRPSLSSFRQKASFSRQRRRRRQRRKGRNGLRLPKVPFCPPPN